jgi:hypothetical protein
LLDDETDGKIDVDGWILVMGEDVLLELGDGEIDTMLSGVELVAVNDDRVTRLDCRPEELLGTKAEL